MMSHAQSLEDSLIALSDDEDGTMKQKKEEGIAINTK